MAFCTNCGAELEEGVRFCTSCGAPVGESEASGDAGSEGTGAVDETVVIEERATAPVSQTAAAADGAQQAAPAQQTASAPASNLPDTSTNLPPVAAPQYAPQPPAPRSQMGPGAIIGITLGVVAAVLVVGFGVFCLANPFGLTDGIFANSAAAQAKQAQEQAEQAESEKEQLQKQLDDANSGQGNNTVVVVPGGSGGYSSSGSPSYSSGGTATYSGGGGTVTVPSGYPPVSISSNGEVLPGSDSRTITTADIANMNDWELCCARNEVIARHGYSFKRDDLRQFFNSLGWYSPNPNYSESWVSKLEWDNMNTILDLERARGSSYVD